jgi:hypothetical protein
MVLRDISVTIIVLTLVYLTICTNTSVAVFSYIGTIVFPYKILAISSKTHSFLFLVITPITLISISKYSLSA